ncbi:MAG TPA: sigma factor-like helix-turn-helix DNA-binding protein [Anaerolineales bacterium]
MDELTADYRSVVLLVDVQGLDYTEAAQTLGIPVGTVKSRLARARVRLRDRLQDSREWSFPEQVCWQVS